MKVNINDAALVKLTPRGETALKQFYEDLARPLPRLEKDPSGRVRLPLWEVMNIFGSSTYHSGEQIIEGNEIELEL